MRDYRDKSLKKENKIKLINSNYEQLEEDKTNLKLAIENHQSMISKTLNDIFNKKRSINNSNKNISSIQEEIERENNIAEKKREKIKELEEKNKYFTDSISNFNNEIQLINDENSSIKNYLQVILKQKNEENLEIDDPIRLTERFVSGLRPKRTVIDVAT